MLPRRVCPIWAVSVLLPIGFAGLSPVYYSFLLRSGRLETQSDSIAIPIVQDFATAAVLTPVILIMTAVALRKYAGPVPLFVWDRSAHLRSIIVSIICVIPAVTAGLGIGYDVLQHLPWYEYFIDLNMIHGIVWLLLIRAAALSRNRL